MRDVNSLNKVILIGRLGGNPELRYLPQTERAVANFTLATNERYYNPNTNESDIRAEWHRIVVWGKLAEFSEKYLSQGKQILVEGKLRTRSWQDRDGNKRYTTEVHAGSIILLGRRDEGPGGDQYANMDPDYPQAGPDEGTGSSSPKDEDPDDDIPF